MKKLLTALLILTAGLSAFCTLRSGSLRLSQSAASDRQGWIAQTQVLVQARFEQVQLQEHVKELNRELSGRGKTAVPEPDVSSMASGLTNLAPAQSERLLAELGFNWTSSGDYLIVSKSSLKAISLEAMNGMKLSQAACQVLALTPEEHGAMESLTQQLGADYKAWARANVRREEPKGDVVAKYTMPAEPAFSQSLSNRFSEGVFLALGQERGELLQKYSYSWMSALGMFGEEPATMTVKRLTVGGRLTCRWRFVTTAA